MKCRKHVKRMSGDEKRRFMEAVTILKDPAQSPSVLHPGAQSRYDDYPETHMMAMMHVPSWAHGGPAFHSWHRELLYRFEQDLQAIDPTVTIPYWDWAKVHEPADDGWPFTFDFIGPDGDPGDGFRVPRDPAHAGDPTYPHPFDPQNWILIQTDAGTGDRLLRRFGSRSDAQVLPNFNTGSSYESNYNASLATTVYDASPWNDDSAWTGSNFRSRSEALHNRVHRWTGGDVSSGVFGTMMLMASPNDPVFWLHHANLDRMWNIWQKRQPAATPYLPSSGAEPGHNLNDALIFNHPGDTPPWAGSTTTASIINSHTMHGSGVWYDSDLPEISLDTPTVAFGNVPEGLTTYRAARFAVKTGRRTRFRITTAPTGNFGMPEGADGAFVDALPDSIDVDGFVWFSFEAIAGVVPPVTVTIQPYIVDDEGEYTGTIGANFDVGPSFDVTLTANVVARTDYAIALVLDRSGSMSAPAGGGSTRSSLLRSAVSTVASLLRDTERLGIVNFDHETATLTTPPLVLMDAAGRDAVQAIVEGPDLEPRGDTGIGLGILEGRDTLNTAPAGMERAMVVFTDGHENVEPDVDDLPPGTLDSRTYAIGFGRVTDVNADVLRDVTQRTDGDLVITGEITSEQQRFLLTKYFVQVLAGIEKLDIVLDPDGELLPGVEAKIPFTISAADVEADVMVLCPVPFALSFELITPSGQTITPAGGPNVKYVLGENVAYYRMLLPALPANPAGSHAGTWTAVLRLDIVKIREALAKNDRETMAAAFQSISKSVPYSVLGHVRSNLHFEARGDQSGFDPGSTMKLHATLREYDVPYRGNADVRAEVARPDGTTDLLPFFDLGQGRYDASYPMSIVGTYRFRVIAEGGTEGGTPFRREKTVTAGVGYGVARPGGRGPTGRGPREFFCRILSCILSRKVISEDYEKRLAELGINLEALRRCLAKTCDRRRDVREPKRVQLDVSAVMANIEALISTRAERGKPIDVKTAPPSIRMDKKAMAKRRETLLGVKKEKK